ncbi:LysR substrate-binding domain-containing protein [Agrobacterium sp. SOY23]|uniref:LysR substrate-binding domain-containing protein n=1 Tax=Agrobacterium sp. SOY23 TaxID=3014555 RepID=UPI0022AF8384|nr:LysR substrate-binding domain-containing protein [Agrobacterium sp. SOY23]MCZ4432964.1 LysR substrate-binding domain-containing protein [Agrobacterium sp. SOY23]
MRNPSLRQLEGLIAVVETGTVSRASEVLRISQPAASKLIQDLELDSGLKLFERESGRLVPTDRGMRLYEEIKRIFGGVNQVARAVEAMRREESGHLVIGVMPSLSGPFLGRVVGSFRARYPDVFVEVETQASQFLTESVLLGRIDLALVKSGLEHPTIIVEPIESPPMAAILPLGHHLLEKAELTPVELASEPFVAFGDSSRSRTKVDAAFEAHGLKPKITMEAATAPNVAEFVAAGLGVTVSDPISMECAKGRVALRPFIPSIDAEYRLYRPARARHTDLVLEFSRQVHLAAANSTLSV